MKKLFLLLMPLMLLAACENGPKTYRFQDIVFDYPDNYQIKSEDIDGDRCELWLVRDGDNFMYLDLDMWEQELLDELTEEELSDGLVEDAYNLYALDLDDEDMDFDDDQTTVDVDDDGIIVAYGGTHSGDPFYCVITNRMYDNYEVTTRSEATNKEILAEMSAIVKSIRLEPKK